MVTIVKRELWPDYYRGQHVYLYCMDATNGNSTQHPGPYTYLVKDMQGHEGKQWWWCESCLREKGIIW